MCKQGLDPSVFLFDNERNCMMLRDDDIERPCVNWHQYSMKARLVNEGTDEQEVVRYKDRLEGSFVASIGSFNTWINMVMYPVGNIDPRTIGGSAEGHPEVVLISHAIVHPSDLHRATKAHGRTVAARRMVKALRDGWEQQVFVFGEYINKEEKVHVLFCSLDPNIPRMMNLNNVEFLPAIYRRLRKING